MIYKAILEVTFNLEDMISKQELEEDWSNELLLFMQDLYGSEGIGIFNEEIKLVDIIKEMEK